MNFLQEISKSNKHQILYREAQKIGLKLFNNNSDLGKHQIIYLNYLELFKNLYDELASGEEYLTEEVINNEVRCAAYLVYRRDKNKEKKPKKRNNSKIPTIISIPPRRK